MMHVVCVIFLNLPAGWGECTGNSEEDDLLAGSDGVDGELLKLVVGVEIGEGALGNEIIYGWSRCFSQ